jgi:hypothetical protein
MASPCVARAGGDQCRRARQDGSRPHTSRWLCAGPVEVLIGIREQSTMRRDDEQDGPRPGDGVMTVAINPVHVTARIDPQLSRWLWLFKWLLVLPHLVVLGLLWIAFGALSVVAFVAILVTGRYPRTIFEFNLGVMRWS